MRTPCTSFCVRRNRHHAAAEASLTGRGTTVSVEIPDLTLSERISA